MEQQQQMQAHMERERRSSNSGTHRREAGVCIVKKVFLSSKIHRDRLRLHVSNFPSRFSFPGPPCCALRGPPSDASTNEHGRSSSSSAAAGTSATFSHGSPASSATSASHGRGASRGRAPGPDGSCRYDRRSQTAPRSKSEATIYHRCSDEVRREIIGLTD